MSSTDVIVGEASIVVHGGAVSEEWRMEGGWHWPNHRMTLEKGRLIVTKVVPYSAPGHDTVEWLPYKRRLYRFNDRGLVCSEGLIFRAPRLTPAQISIIRHEYRELTAGPQLDAEKFDARLSWLLVWALQGSDEARSLLFDFRSTYPVDGVYGESLALTREIYSVLEAAGRRQRDARDRSETTSTATPPAAVTAP